MPKVNLYLLSTEYNTLLGITDTVDGVSVLNTLKAEGDLKIIVDDAIALEEREEMKVKRQKGVRICIMSRVWHLMAEIAISKDIKILKVILGLIRYLDGEVFPIMLWPCRETAAPPRKARPGDRLLIDIKGAVKEKIMTVRLLNNAKTEVASANVTPDTDGNATLELTIPTTEPVDTADTTHYITVEQVIETTLDTGEEIKHTEEHKIKIVTTL